MISAPPALTRVILCLSLLITSAWAQQPAPAPAPARESAESQFNTAKQVYNYGRGQKDYYKSRQALQTAEKAFRTFTKQHPRNELRKEAYYSMAVCQLLTGNTDSAESNFERIISAYKTGHWVGASAYRLAAQHFNRKDYIMSAKYFKIASRQYQKEELATQALYQYSRSLLLSNKNNEAITPLKELAESPTIYAEISRLALAKIYYQNGDYENATPHFQQLYKSKALAEKDNAESFLYYGLCLSKMGKKEEAISVLQQALKNPNTSEADKAKAQHEVFDMYYQAGDYDTIISEYQKGLYAGEPQGTAQTYLYAGYALLKKEHYTRAVNAFNTVEGLRPNTQEGFEASYRRLYCFYQIDSASVTSQADSFYNNYKGRGKGSDWHMLSKVYKAETLYSNGQIESAAKVYRLVDSEDIPLSLQPNFLYKKLICLAENEDYLRSIKSASAFISNFPNHDLLYEVRLRRANALLNSDNNAAAATDFEIVLEDLPESPLAAMALQGLIQVYRKDRRYEELVESCELLLGKFPALKQQPRAHANYWLGWGRFKLEEFDKAIPPLQQARRLAPDFYKEASGTRILYSTYYLRDPKAMKVAHDRVLNDVPGKYFPPKMLAWLGIQSYQNKDFVSAQKVLNSIANREKPTETPIDVWRYLAKSYLELGQYPDALVTANVVAALEEKSFWKADALLDVANAQLGLNNLDEAISKSKEGLNYEPKGTIQSSLRFTIAEAHTLRGDVIAAKDEYLLVAAEFDGDQAIHPIALWKTAQLLQQSDPDSASAMKSLLEQRYPDWQAPKS